MSNLSSEMVEIVAGVILILAAVQILFLLSLRAVIGQCAPPNRTISPGQVWFVFIPLFNIVWQFLMIARIAESLQREFAARQIPPRSPGDSFGKRVGIAMCILSLASAIPIAGIFTAAAAMVCWIVYWVKISRYSQVLEGAGAALAQGSGPASPWPILLIVMLGVLAGGIPIHLQGAVVAQARQNIGIDLRDFSWVLSNSVLSILGGYLLMGILVTIAGSRIGFLVSIAGLALATAAAGLASDSTSLGLTFAAIGFFSRGLFPAALLAVREWFEPGLRPLAVGLVAAAQAFPSLLLALVFGPLAGQVSWRLLIFAGALPAAVSAALCVVFWTAPTVRHPFLRPLSGKSIAALAMLAVGLFVMLPVSDVPFTRLRFLDPMLLLRQTGWNVWLALFAIAGCLGAGFLAWAMQSSGVPPGRARALLLTGCGVILPIIATSLSDTPLFLRLAGLVAMLAFQAWATLLDTAVVDTFPVAGVAIGIAIGEMAATLSGSTMTSLMLRSSPMSSHALLIAAALLGALMVALMAWLIGMEPAVD